MLCSEFQTTFLLKPQLNRLPQHLPPPGVSEPSTLPQQRPGSAFTLLARGKGLLQRLGMGVPVTATEADRDPAVLCRARNLEDL